MAKELYLVPNCLFSPKKNLNMPILAFFIWLQVALTQIKFILTGLLFLDAIFLKYGNMKKKTSIGKKNAFFF